MWKLDFRITGTIREDVSRRKQPDDPAATRRGFIWVVAGLVLVYILGTGSRTAGIVAIVAPGDGASTFDSRVTVLGTVSDSEANQVTLRVNDRTQIATVNNGVFQIPIELDVGANKLVAAFGDLESVPVAITRKARPIVLISSTSPPSPTVEQEVEVLGTAENLENDSITIEANGQSKPVQTNRGTFSTRVAVGLGTNIISAFADGSEKSAITVVRTEAAKPAIAITFPNTNEYASARPSLEVRGAVVNSDVHVIRLERNGEATRVDVVGGQFHETVILSEGLNRIQAFLVHPDPALSAESNVVVAKLNPIQITIRTEPPVSDLLARLGEKTVLVTVLGNIENSDPASIDLMVNKRREALPVVERKFVKELRIFPDVTYRINATLDGKHSNTIDIYLPRPKPPAPEVEPRPEPPTPEVEPRPKPPTPEVEPHPKPPIPEKPESPQTSPTPTVDCRRIDCDCNAIQLPKGDSGRQAVMSKQVLDKWRSDCLAAQKSLVTECLRTGKVSGSCPRLSGPKAWPRTLRKKAAETRPTKE
jgi:hypothetical protein